MASGINLKKAQLAYNNVNKDIKNLETQLANFRKAVAEMNANIWYGGNSANKWYESANNAYKKDCKFLDSLYNIQVKLSKKIDSTLAVSGSTEKTQKSGKGSGAGGGSGSGSGTKTGGTGAAAAETPTSPSTETIQDKTPETSTFKETTLKYLKEHKVPQENIEKISSALDDFNAGKISVEEYTKIYNKEIEGIEGLKPYAELTSGEKKIIDRLAKVYGFSEKDLNEYKTYRIMRATFSDDASIKKYNEQIKKLLDSKKPNNLSDAQWYNLKKKMNNYIEHPNNKKIKASFEKDCVALGIKQTTTGNVSSQDQYAAQISNESKNKSETLRISQEAASMDKKGNLSSQDQYAREIRREELKLETANDLKRAAQKKAVKSQYDSGMVSAMTGGGSNTTTKTGLTQKSSTQSTNSVSQNSVSENSVSQNSVSENSIGK